MGSHRRCCTDSEATKADERLTGFDGFGVNEVYFTVSLQIDVLDFFCILFGLSSLRDRDQ